MCTYEHLVDATLPHGLIPYVVPQLKTITLGGAVTGLGIESTSFRSGLPHESVEEMDVFTGAGEVVTTRPGDDLFDTFPNSYGSLGYATRLRIKLERVPDRVELRHVRFDDAGLLVEDRGRDRRDPALRRAPGRRARRGGVPAGGVLPHPGPLAQRRGGRRAPIGGEPKALEETSDYTGQQVYYRSIQQRATTDLLTMHDYLWRWDTDWFWCSGAFGVQNPTVRRLWPQRWRRSDVYHRLIGLNHRTGFMDWRRPPQGPAAARAGGPGRRDPGRAARGVPGLVRRRGRDAPGLAVPARQPRHQHRRASGRPTRSTPARRTSTSASGAPCTSDPRPRTPRATARSRPRSRSSAGTSRSTPRRSTTARPSTSSTTAPHLAAVKRRYDPDDRLLSLYDKAVRDR